MRPGSNNIYGPLVLVILDSIFLSSLLVYTSFDFSSADHAHDPSGVSASGLFLTEEDCPAIAQEGKCR